MVGRGGDGILSTVSRERYGFLRRHCYYFVPVAIMMRHVVRVFRSINRKQIFKFIRRARATKVPKIRKSHYRFEIRLFPHTGNHRRRRVNLLFRRVKRSSDIATNIIESRLLQQYNATGGRINLN